MNNINAFEKKERELMGCLDLFHKINDRKQHNALKKHIRDNHFNNKALAYKIDYYELRNDIQDCKDKMALQNIENILSVFHNYPREDIRSLPFYASMLADGSITEQEMQTIVNLYEGVLYTFRENAIIMEQLLEDYGVRRMDNTSRSAKIFHIEPYDIIPEYHTTPIATKGRHRQTFKDIIQCKDKNKLLRRLHELIDGKRGADVGAVLFNAWYKNKYLSKKPTRAIFESEFQLIGSWSAINNYMNLDNANAHTRASQIVIFK